MRKLLVVLLILVLLAVAIDVLARRAAEDQVADRLQRTFDLTSEPKVSLGGTPFLLALLQGDVSSIEMTAERVRSEDIALEDVEVEMNDLRFSLSDVVDGSGTVTADGGNGSATITEAGLNRALDTAGAPLTLSLADGRATASSEAGGGSADILLEGNALSVAAGGAPAVIFDLPTLGDRVTYESVTIESGRVGLSFSVAGVRLSS